MACRKLRQALEGVRMKSRLKEGRTWIALALAGAVCWFVYPVMRVGVFLAMDPARDDAGILLTEERADDASGLNAISHKGIVRLSSDLAETEKLLRETLERARAEKLSVVPFGARHSMGKQALREGALHIDTSGFDHLEMDGELLRAQAGARWWKVIRFLAERGLTVEVMQSNNDFSIGGTLSVNAHGWQPDRPPVASTVEKFRLMLPDGSIRVCSRTEEANLFRHALGGYGLFGIILDTWIRPVPNEMLRSKHVVMSADQFAEGWKAEAVETEARLAYGRLSVAPSTFFQEVMLTVYESTGEIQPTWKPQERDDWMTKVARATFRASLGSQRGKGFRWFLEKNIGGEASGSHPRSYLLNEPAWVFANSDPEKTDLLLEFFVPQIRFAEFARAARKILEGQADDLMNVTIRQVKKDTDTALPYAKEDMFGFVMLFTVERSAKGAASLEDRARRLTDEALKLGGSIYLPYRNYATPGQLMRAYPEFPAFVKEKQAIDPTYLFTNGFFDYYAQAIDFPAE